MKKSFFIGLILLLVLLAGCSDKEPTWSMHGSEAFNGEYLSQTYDLRYQAKPLCEKVKCCLSVKIDNTEVSYQEYNYNTVKEMDVLQLQNTIPLDKLKNFNPKSPNNLTRIDITWTDSNEVTHYETIEPEIGSAL